MNKLEAFKKMSAAFFKTETDEAVISVATDIQDAEDIADALAAFAYALDLQNTPADPSDTGKA